ncbi:hypothetical protein [Duganella sp. HH101]|uniref:hypothetical protein n=1 Tax=Duganella sp. HH101 TaxID=1781066 RepID=UPI000873CF7E|nr:hypothetical protein [Duganella sp. HH101]
MKEKFFRYFFDCGGGAVGKKLIDAEFEQTNFDFGVISHFDKDHFSQLDTAKVKRVFIPYLEELDMFFLTLAHYVQSKEVFDFSAELVKLSGKLDLVMVQHVPPNDNYREDMLGPGPTGDNLGMMGIKAIRQGGVYSISDSANIYVGSKDHNVVTLKFYNHRSEKLRTAIDVALNDALTNSAAVPTPPKKTTTKGSKPAKAPTPAPALSNESGTPYTTIEEFLASVKANPAEIIHKNAGRLKAVYEEVLNGHGESGVSPSNLSSLTMFSVTSDSSDRYYHHDQLFSKPAVEMSSPGNFGYETDGWMLTGDLELTGSIWAEFYDHYNLAIEQCAVFNVPHHGSVRAFDDSAIHQITTNKYFIFPVSSTDKAHPAPSLIALLDSYDMDRDRATSVTEIANSRFTLTRLYCER